MFLHLVGHRMSMSEIQKQHTHGLCAAFQLTRGPVLLSKGHVFACKDAPREKKAMSFYHADIPFFIEDALCKQKEKPTN